MAVISETLENDLQQIGNFSFVLQNTKDWRNENVNAIDADEITVYLRSEESLDFFSYKLPKNKIVDLDWIMNKWNRSKDNSFENFAINFKSLLPERYKNSINVYATSYGIGIFVLFNKRDLNLELKKEIDLILTSKGIEFKNQSSDAGWVFRYIISKSKENISKL